MNDLPKTVDIEEEGPREGFQIETRSIPTSDKVRFIEALAQTGLRAIQAVSFVDARRVPGMADAEAVVAAIRHQPGVRYTGLWLNRRGFERACETNLDLSGKLQISASETFSLRNTNRDTARTLADQGQLLDAYRERGISVGTMTIMTAFGCNYEGAVAPQRVCDCIAMLLDLVAEHDLAPGRVALADTVGWANPNSVQRVIGLVRERWPSLPLKLHLHDTRGTGIANALTGLRMGISNFDTSCGGLGGCPFAAHKAAAGNVCTEDLVFMCHEMGIETGIDLDALIECARMAEEIVGHQLPGKIMHAGSLSRFRGAA